MKTDSELERDVRGELSRQPGVDATEIGVSALAGVVTLTGQAPSDLAKRSLADSISGMPGVNSLVDEVLVFTDTRIRAPDPDIARPWFSAN